MKTLTKIRLINWHYFENETINVKNNALLTGVNGSGKSTIIDAITFVITAGDQVFNLAASDKSKRDLRGYVKCKLGSLDQEYLRDYDLSGHICLEYYSEKQEKYFCLGSVIDIEGEAKPPKVIFYIIDGPMKDEYFITEDYEVKNTLDFKKSKVTPYIFTSRKEAKAAFRQKMGGISEKYFTLLPKALAFKPLTNVKDYIYNHLLEEKQIHTENIRDSIRSYKEFEGILKVTKNKIEDLKTIKETYETAKSIKENKDFYEYLLKVLTKKEAEKEVESKNKKILKLEQEMDQLKEDTKEIDEQVASIDDKSKQLYASLSNNEDFRASEIYDRDIKRLDGEVAYSYEKKREFDRRKQAFRDAKEALKNVDAKLYKELSKVNLDVESEDDCKELSKKLDELRTILSEKRDEIQDKTSTLNAQKALKVKEIQEVLQSLNQLSGTGTLPYAREIVVLRQKMEEHLKKIYNENIPVHVLSEIIEVKDKSWQNTVEDLLGRQRFTLIVEPKYYDECLLCYNENKSKNLFGVNLLNTKKIQNFTTYQPNSLASIIETENRDARYYINYTIGNLIMVDDVRDLEHYNQAITKDGMLYRGFTTSYLNPNTPKPFIGSSARQVQLNKYQKLGEEKKAEFQKITEDIQALAEQADIVNGFDLSIIKELVKEVQNYYKNTKQIEELKAKKKELSLSSVESLRREYEGMLQEIRLLNQRKATILESQGAKRQAIEQMNQDILDLINNSKTLTLEIQALESINTLYQSRSEELYNKEKEEGKSPKEIEESIRKEIEDGLSSIKSLENSLTVGQVNYISKYNRPFGTGYDRCEEYLEELDKLERSELVKYEAKVRDARESAEKLFKEDFLSKLRSYILEAQDEISKINETLSKIKFGNDQYEFIFPKSKEFGTIYDMITDKDSNEVGYSVFDEKFEEKYQKELDELFNNLSADEENSQGAINKFTDYRTYMDYDIKVISNEDVFYFSNISNVKSGGEMQIPFYVAILASFVRLFDKAEKNGLDDSVGLILFDEVFDKMDNQRTEAMMEFINNLPVQIILACPPQKMETLSKHTGTVITAFRNNKKAGTFIINNK